MKQVRGNVQIQWINTLFIGYFTGIPICIQIHVSHVYRKRYWQHTVNLYRVLRSCLKTFNVYISNYSYRQKKGNAKWKSQEHFFLCTKIYHTYHTFILIWYPLGSVITVLSEYARLLAFSSQFWLRHRLFLHVTNRKAYCKQLNPHSFLQNS